MNYELKHSSPPKSLMQLSCMCESWGKGVGAEHGVPWKATEMATNIYLQVVTRVQQVLCCNSDTHSGLSWSVWRYHAFLLACWTSKLYTRSNKATGSQQERKKESRSLSACQLHTPPPTWLCCFWGTYNISLSFIRKWGIFSRVPKSGCTSK